MPSREHHCCGHAHERENLSEWTDRLQSAGHKLTKPRRAVLELLHQQKHPITNRDVHAELSAECDLASIYRTMHLLMEMSLVQQFDFEDYDSNEEELSKIVRSMINYVDQEADLDKLFS